MRLALTISALAWAVCSMAQTPGQIFRTAFNDSLLDPNGDGWISQTTSGFSDVPTIIDESEEFETAWNVLWHYEAEPSSDLQTGSTCGPTEIVDNPNTNEHAAYWKIHDPDGVAGNDDELLMFRMRINQDPNNAAYGYSFLIDSDQQFGITGSNFDPNAMAGNPGFEYEILFASGNSGGVYVNDVDGVAQHNQITNLKTYNDGVNDQRAYARFSNCTGTTDPIFIDFFIAFADLGASVTSNSTLRMVFASASSANSALNGSASDVGGIADGDYPDDDSMFETYVAAVPTIQFSTGYSSIVDVDNDGVDDASDNCTDTSACNYDGSVNNVACVFPSTWYADSDGDGLGDSSDSQSACAQPSGYVSDATDLCDDNTACNYDANSVTNAACTFATTWYADSDGDGLGDSSDSQSACAQPSGYVSDATDLCDDNTACNYDANSVTNAACTFATTWYADSDGDGLGDSSDSQSACAQPSGYVSDATDLCDDNTACNYDANSVTNAACTFATTWYADSDGDGLGDSSDSQSACAQPSGYVSDATDLCDDNTACNYDANSVTNAACTFATTWYADSDGDGLGDSSDSQSACAQPSGYVSDATDLCDDNTACNYDANSVTNAACTFATTWYADSDGDGLGDSSDSQSACAQPSGYVSDATDLCDDNTACNYDANSVTNAACTFATTWYADSDGDGLGDSSDSQSACAQPSGYVSDATDLCDDNTACNYDANSVTNAACTFATTWYADSDGDGLGDSSDSQSACAQPSGYVSDATDLCDDNTACNYDANSVTNAACTFATTWYADSDGDGLGDSSDSQSACAQPSGYVSDATDLCDDNTACNYDANSVTNAACQFNDAIGVCGGTCTTDSDSDGVCDDGGADLCTDDTATNYTANPTEACSFPAPALTVSDTITGCVDQTDAVALDLDTLHTGTGSWNYTISQDVTGSYAAATLTGSVLSVDFSAAGQDSSTVELTGTNGTDNIAINILVVEGTYPFVTSSAPDGANEPTSPTGGVGMTFDGGYGVPLMVHYYEDAVYSRASDGTFNVHAYGEELTAMTDSSGSLITLPAGDYFITGYTNHWGCYNPEPATSGTPTANPSYRMITVPHLLPD